MRFDKFTTKFQQAFADAQSLAVGNDNAYIEPQHLFYTLVNQQDGGTASLLLMEMSAYLVSFRIPSNVSPSRSKPSVCNLRV